MYNVAFQGRKAGKMATNQEDIKYPSMYSHKVACQSLRTYIYECLSMYVNVHPSDYASV